MYISLIAAMIFGRMMFGLALFMLGLFMDLPYNTAQFFSTGGAIIAGLPGIAIQIVIVPVIVAALNRRRPN